MVNSLHRSGEDPRATGGLVFNLPHPRVNKTKHTLKLKKEKDKEMKKNMQKKEKRQKNFKEQTYTHINSDEVQRTPTYTFKNNHDHCLDYQHSYTSLETSFHLLKTSQQDNNRSAHETRKHKTKTKTIIILQMKYNPRKQKSLYSISTYKSITSIQNLIFSIHFKHTNTITSTNIHVSEVHCGSAVRFSQALPGYLITAHHLYTSLR